MLPIHKASDPRSARRSLFILCYTATCCTEEKKQENTFYGYFFFTASASAATTTIGMVLCSLLFVLQTLMLNTMYRRENFFSFFMSSWEIYRFSVWSRLPSCVRLVKKLTLEPEPFNISFISIIKINGHLLVNFPSMPADYLRSLSSRLISAIYFHLIPPTRLMTVRDLASMLV
jgi:hypothetical protein